MASTQQQNKSRPEDVLGDAPVIAPDVWTVAASARVPDDAWEFHARKNANDAAYQGLDFAPYCSTMPVVPPPPSTATAATAAGVSAAAAGGGGAAAAATAVPKWAWKKRAPR